MRVCLPGLIKPNTAGNPFSCTAQLLFTFLPREPALARHSYGPMSLHLSEAGTVSKRLHGSACAVHTNEIRVPPTISVLSSGTLYQTLEFKIVHRRRVR